MNSNSPSSLLKSVAENAALNRAEKEIATSLAQNTSLEEKTTKIQNLIYELLTTHPDFYLGSRRDANFLVDFHRQHIEHRNYYNTLLNALEKKYHTSSN